MSTTAVKIKVTIAQPFVIAGQPFSLTTSLENAHEELIEVVEFLYHIPYQVQWIMDVKYDAAFEESRSANLVRRLMRASAWRAAAQPPGQVMQFANMKSPGTPIVTVLPAQTTSYSFKALVPQWLFVSGGELVFPGRITYRYKGALHSAPFEVRLTMRPPLRSNGIGALLGAVLGTSAKMLKDQQGAGMSPGFGIEFVAATVLAAILSVIAIVYSSRRTGESQPILTVEDFWGGLIVGFMIGYLGHEFFQKIVPIG